MSGFGFSEAQELFRQTIRSFAQKELGPGARERSKLGRYPRDILKKVAQQGIFAINMPAQYGGQPADWITMGIAMEELTRVDLALGDCLGSQWLVSLSLTKASPELQKEWLPSLIGGEKLATIALSEPGGGSDLMAMETRATGAGQDYILVGEKTAIGELMNVDMVIVYAKTDPQAGARGISCFLLPLPYPGAIRSPLSYMGLQPSAFGALTLDRVQLPGRLRLGEEGRGLYAVLGDLQVSRIFLGLWALGGAQACVEEAITYSKQRHAFGFPLAKYEAISFKIAEHATLTEAARWLCYRTLWLKDQGLPHNKESAMAKWLSARVASQAAHDCLLIHGHVGWSQEHPVQQRLRDLIGLEIAEGTEEMMKLTIARELIGKEAIPYR